MAKSQLPLVTSMMMVTQAVLATPVGLRAKRSIEARNGLLLLGFGAMISADLVFALTNNAAGQSPTALVCHTAQHACSVLFAHLQNYFGAMLRAANSVQSISTPAIMCACSQALNLAVSCGVQACSWAQPWWAYTWP